MTKRSVASVLLAPLFALASLPAASRPVAAQEVRVGVAPDTVRVGDIFRAVVRVVLPPGYGVVLPDSLPLGGEAEQAGRRRDVVDELPGGGRRVTATYPLSAWRPGPLALPAVAVRLVGPAGERTIQARLPSPVVRSVLPADTQGVEPRGLKDVLGASRTLWPLLLALLAGAVAVSGALYWRRRARAVPALLEAPVSPLERALRALDRARELGLVEAAGFKPFYSLVSDAVRGYLAALNPAWGVELTTTELLERAAAGMPPETAAVLARILRAADLVKFARRRPEPDEAVGDWEAARAWVLAYRGAPAAWPAAGGAVEGSPGRAAEQEVA